MRLYLIERVTIIGYDEHDSMVVCANDEAQARELAGEKDEQSASEWIASDTINSDLHAKITLIGHVFAEDATPRVVLASFNAG
jgi:hypothetical protein